MHVCYLTPVGCYFGSIMNKLPRRRSSVERMDVCTMLALNIAVIILLYIHVPCAIFIILLHVYTSAGLMLVHCKRFWPAICMKRGRPNSYYNVLLKMKIHEMNPALERCLTFSLPYMTEISVVIRQ